MNLKITKETKGLVDTVDAITNIANQMISVRPLEKYQGTHRITVNIEKID